MIVREKRGRPGPSHFGHEHSLIALNAGGIAIGFQHATDVISDQNASEFTAVLHPVVEPAEVRLQKLNAVIQAVSAQAQPSEIKINVMKLCAYPGRRESKSPAAVFAFTDPELISLKAHQRKLPRIKILERIGFRLIGIGILAHRHRHLCSGQRRIGLSWRLFPRQVEIIKVDLQVVVTVIRDDHLTLY